MKKLSLFILVAMAASFAALTNTGCSGSGGPIPQDTVENNDTTPTTTSVNGFTIGFDKYELDVNEAQTFGEYYTAGNRTFILISGQDPDQSTNEEAADLTLELDSNIVGTFTNSNGNARIDLGTGSGVKRNEYTSDGGSCSITVTAYDAVGGRIKGTFSGAMKLGVSTTQLKDGYFDVLRKSDK